MNRKIASLLGLSLLCVSLTNAQPKEQQPSDEDLLLDAMHQTIKTEKLFNYVKQFSAPELEGRLAGSEGMAKATAIVEGYYKDWGLIPITDNGHIQSYPHPHVEVHEGSTMEILLPTKNKKNKTTWIAKSYPWADGWFAGGATANGDITADIVYAGFGVTAPELNYDDYKNIDVKGKIVLIEGETPNRSREKDSLLMWYPHTLHQYKLNNAVAHGAIGMLYKWVPGPNAAYNDNFVYCHVTDTVVNDLFAINSMSYKETVDKIYTTKKPASFDMGVKARIKMNATYHPTSTGKNVFGVIKGSDPILSDEYIVISAHLDHLGMIPYLIEGANDNNTACAALLGVAETFAKSSVKPKRSILFMILDGEEAGLTGSTYYTQNPIIDKDKIKGVINLEQLGGGEMLGASYHYQYPELAEAAEKANDKYIHRKMFSRENQFITRPRTDGAVFMKAGYPCMDLRAIGGGFYHHPKDNVESINPDILRSATEWLFWTTYLLADKE